MGMWIAAMGATVATATAHRAHDCSWEKQAHRVPNWSLSCLRHRAHHATPYGKTHGVHAWVLSNHKHVMSTSIHLLEHNLLTEVLRTQGSPQNPLDNPLASRASPR